MFWNVQNAWDYTVTSPEEMAAYLLIDKRQGLYGDFLNKAHDFDVWDEAGRALVAKTWTEFDRKRLQAAIDEWKNAPLPDAQAQLAALIGLASELGPLDRRLAGALKKARVRSYDPDRGQVSKSRRDWIVEVCRRIAPQLLVVVEPATTKGQIDFALERQNSPVSRLEALAGEAQDLGGVWVAYQLAVSLGTKWQCWASPINSTVAWIKKQKVDSKNSFFELYTALWDASSSVRLTDPGGFLPGPYPERAPYRLCFGIPRGQFHLVFTHAVFGNVAERKETLRILGEDLAREPFASEPLVVMGDFNLDYGSPQNRRLYDALHLGPSLTDGTKTTFTSRWTEESKGYTKNAYDQVFLRNVPKIVGGGVYDYAESVFHLREASKHKLDFTPFDEVRKVSDHLPVWCEVDFP
jgi:endonuclease/exonuclease/phosphatase family metal-dependent hydrolase